MRDAINKFMINMNALNEKDYMFNLITYGIAPTICGYKASTLINLSSKYKNTYTLWEKYKDEYIARTPLKYYELNKTENTYTVLFYDENILNSRVRQTENLEFLNTYGYKNNESIISFLFTLKERYRLGCPHEIGLFLDIPLLDVLGFIKNQGKNHLYCGYWKVYNDVEKAKDAFEKYDLCKKKVIELIALGKGTFQVIEELSVFSMDNIKDSVIQYNL